MEENKIKEYIEMARNSAYGLLDVPKEVLIKHPEICEEALKEDGDAIQFIPKEVLMEHPKICIELVKEYTAALEYIPKEVLMEHPEICLEAVKEYGDALMFTSRELRIEHPEICIEAVKQQGTALQYVPIEVTMEHPEIYVYAVRQQGLALQYVPDDVQKERPEICVEALKQNINIYTSGNFKGRNLDEVQTYMFVDPQKLKKIKEKAHFDITSYDFNELQMDIFYHKMIKSIGLDEVKSLVNVPNITLKQLEEYGILYDQKVNEIFDVNYEATGDLGALFDIFRMIDFKKYEAKGKNVKFDIYKNLNLILEEESSRNLKLDELLKESITRSKLEIDDGFIEKVNMRKNEIINHLYEEKMSNLDSRLVEMLNENVRFEKIPIKKIIETKIKESMKENDGKYITKDVMRKIEEELRKKKRKWFKLLFTTYNKSKRWYIKSIK